MQDQTKKRSRSKKDQNKDQDQIKIAGSIDKGPPLEFFNKKIIPKWLLKDQQ